MNRSVAYIANTAIYAPPADDGVGGGGGMINEIRNPDDNGRRLCEAYVVEISIFRPKNARTCTPTCTKTLKVVIFDF